MVVILTIYVIPHKALWYAKNLLMIPPHWQSILTKKTSDPSPSPTPAINDDWLLILLCFFFKFFSDKAWARDILCLRVKCKQSATGCGWIGQLRHAEVSGLFF